VTASCEPDGWDRARAYLRQVEAETLAAEQATRDKAAVHAKENRWVPIFPDQRIRGWPQNDGMVIAYRPLEYALTNRFTTDAHFAAYCVPEIARRMRLAALEDIDALAQVPGGIPMNLAIFDVDCELAHKASGGTSEIPAPDAWWAEERSKLNVLLLWHPDVFVYRTKGGYRIVFWLAEPAILRSQEEAAAWTCRYAQWIAALRTRFQIFADPACKEWTRMFRLPHATREEGGLPEDRETIGDPRSIGVWILEPDAGEIALAKTLVREKAARPQRNDAHEGEKQAKTALGAGVLFHAFQARGDLGDAIEGGKWAIACPWEDQHSKGQRYDGGTVLFAPGPGEDLGFPYCAHAHCQHRELKEWLGHFSREELARARAREPVAVPAEDASLGEVRSYFEALGTAHAGLNSSVRTDAFEEACKRFPHVAKRDCDIWFALGAAKALSAARTKAAAEAAFKELASIIGAACETVVAASETNETRVLQEQASHLGQACRRLGVEDLLAWVALRDAYRAGKTRLLTDTALCEALDAGFAAGAEKAANEPTRGENNRIVIEITPTGLEKMATLAGDALAEDGRAFQRGHRLVQLVHATQRAEQRSGWRDSEDREHFAIRAGAPVIDELGRPTLLGFLDTAASWIKYDEDGARRCLPPGAVVSLVREWKQWPSIPPLKGVANAPLLRADGTVCQRAGYDVQTGWWLELGTEFPIVPEQPTQEDGRAAYALLESLFADFPYTAACHRAVPIAAILTLFGRPAIDGAVPGFVFDASTGGTGKTLHGDVIALVVTGRLAARKSYSETEEELEKLFGGYAINGAHLICIDDVKRTFGGATLDMLLTTRDEAEFRILGKTEVRSLPWRAVILATGNNMSFSGQMARRVLMARLESALERPQDRADFRIPNLLHYVRQERAKLVHAALVVLRAWSCQHARKSTLGTWGSFEEWAELIPPAILYAGGPNVLDARPPDDGDINPEADALRDAVGGLARLEKQRAEEERMPISGLLSEDICNALYGPEGLTERFKGGATNLEPMASALRELTRTKPPGDPSSRAIGYVLRKHKGRVIRVGDHFMKIVVAGHDAPGRRSRHKGKGALWHVVDLGPTDGSSGDGLERKQAADVISSAAN
jgi:hypothetical protein